MTELLSRIGGIETFVKPHQSVLIKPNLLTDREPAEAVTTHPEVVRALIHVLKELGAESSVADSPASAVKLERVWERTGFASMCSEESVPLINMEKAGSVGFDVGGYSFTIAKPILEADVIINVPKVKTHVLTIFTAAVKNMYGGVPGFAKTHLHKMHPTPSDFGRLLTEIYGTRRPNLNIADAIQGMEGDGPGAGRPAQLGFLAASSDAVALDLTLCRILGINPVIVPYLRQFLECDRIRGEWETIRIVGADPDDLAPGSFRVPSTLRSRLIPGCVVSMLRPFIWFRPSMSDDCMSCGLCVKACPVTALTLERKQEPVLDPRKCIGCCCCHEICPEKAVSMMQSPLLNVIRRGKTP